MWRIIVKLLQCTQINATSQTHHHNGTQNAQIHWIYDTVSANDMDAFSSIMTTPTHIYFTYKLNLNTGSVFMHIHLHRLLRDWFQSKRILWRVISVMSSHHHFWEDWCLRH